MQVFAGRLGSWVKVAASHPIQKRPEEEGNPLRDLSFWEQAPPMAPSEDRSTGEKNQAGHRRTAGPRRRLRRPRSRGLFAERMRAAISPPASADALLQRGVPGGRTTVARVESTTSLSPIRRRQTKAASAKPAIPAALETSPSSPPRAW